MPTSFVYPTSYEVFLLQAEYMFQDMDGRKLLDLMPFRYENSSQIVWEQPDNNYGLMQLRGQGGKPSVITQTGFKQFTMKPGFYGETIILGEEELTDPRQPGTKGDVIDLNWLTSWRVQQLTERGLNQVENIIATLLTTGTFAVRSGDGAVTHADTIANFNLFTPSQNWTNISSATPLADLLGWKAQAQKGTSSRFGRESKLLVNSFTLNDLLDNQNSADLAGKRMTYGSTPFGVQDLNKILDAYDLPQIEVYDGGYFTTPGTATTNATGFTFFLPRGQGVWMGTRPKGQRVGEFVLTRNVNAQPPEGAAVDYLEKNPDLGSTDWLQGIYTKVVVKTDETPVYYRLDHGYNGGPALYYSTAVNGLYYSAAQP